MSKEEHDKIQKQFDTALATRNFEIELFWKRAVFFWGFIGAAFVGFATLQEKHPGYALIVANFGMICSFAWCLVNRGSKYWQVKWEKEVEKVQEPIVGKIFSNPKEKRFSVSKLLIALSDYTFILWVGIVIYEMNRENMFQSVSTFFKNGKTIWTAFSILYLGYLFFFGKSRGNI